MVQIGDRIGSLTVIGEAERSACRKIAWLVRCDCGFEYKKLQTDLNRKTKTKQCNKCATKTKALTSEQKALAEKWFDWSQAVARKTYIRGYSQYEDDICSAAAFGLVLAARTFDEEKVRVQGEESWKSYCLFKIRYEIIRDLRWILPRTKMIHRMKLDVQELAFRRGFMRHKVI